MPNAMYFIITISEKANAPVTTMRMSAAEVMIPPVRTTPLRIEFAVDSPRERASTIRESRNTS